MLRLEMQNEETVELISRNMVVETDPVEIPLRCPCHSYREPFT